MAFFLGGAGRNLDLVTKDTCVSVRESRKKCERIFGPGYVAFHVLFRFRCSLPACYCGLGAGRSYRRVQLSRNDWVTIYSTALWAGIRRLKGTHTRPQISEQKEHTPSVASSTVCTTS
jgi:hypothetical protein